MQRLLLERVLLLVGIFLREVQEVTSTLSISSLQQTHENFNERTSNATRIMQEESRVLQQTDMDHSAVSNRKRNNISNIGNTNGYRLCNLDVIMPFTNGKGQLITTEGFSPTFAAMLAMKHFNTKTADIVPNLKSNPAIQQCKVKLTMSHNFLDSELDPIVATRAFLESLEHKNDGEEDTVNRTQMHAPPPCAVLGSFRPSVTDLLSIMASVREILTMSFSSSVISYSTPRMWGTTAPNHAVGTAQATLQYLHQVLHVTHVAILYANSDFGTAYHQAVTQQVLKFNHDNLSKMHVVCVRYEEDDPDSIQNATLALKDTKYNYFLAVTTPETQTSVFHYARQAKILGPDKFWIFNQEEEGGSLSYKGFDSNDVMDANIVTASRGVGMVELDMEQNKALEKAWMEAREDEEFVNLFLSKLPPHVNLTTTTSIRNLLNPLPTLHEHFMYDSIMALGIAACQSPTKKDYYINGEGLFQSLVHNVSFQGASGRVAFDRTGARDPRDLLYKLSVSTHVEPELQEGQRQQGVRVRMQFQSKTVARQQFVVKNPQELKRSYPHVIWKTIAPTIYAGGTTQPPGIVEQGELQQLTPWLRAVGLILALSAMIKSVGWMIWTFVHCKTCMVQQATLVCLVMLCGGAFFMAASVIPMSLLEPLEEGRKVLDGACMSIPWLYQFGFAAAFSALVSRSSVNKQIYRKAQNLIRNQTERKAKKQNKDKPSVIFPFAFISIVNFALLISWTVVSPSHWTRFPSKTTDSYGVPILSYGSCSSEHDRLFLILFACFDVSLILASLVLHFQAPAHVVSLHRTTNEDVVIAMATILQAIIVGLPVFVIAKAPGTKFLVRSVVITVICYAVLLAIFVPMERARRADVERRKKNILPSTPSRRKLQDTWNVLVNAKTASWVKKRPTKFWSSIIYQANSNRNLREDSLPSEELANDWAQGLDELAL